MADSTLKTKNEFEQNMEAIIAKFKAGEDPKKLAEFFYSKHNLNEAMAYYKMKDFREAWDSYFKAEHVKDAAKKNQVSKERIDAFCMGEKTFGSYGAMMGEGMWSLGQGATWKGIGGSIKDWYTRKKDEATKTYEEKSKAGIVWYGIKEGAKAEGTVWWETLNFFIPLRSAWRLFVDTDDYKNTLMDPSPRNMYVAVRTFESSFLDAAMVFVPAVAKGTKRIAGVAKGALGSEEKLILALEKDVEKTAEQARARLVKDGVKGLDKMNAEKSIEIMAKTIKENLPDLVAAGKFRAAVYRTIFDSVNDPRKFQRMLLAMERVPGWDSATRMAFGDALGRHAMLKQPTMTDDLAKALIAETPASEMAKVSKNARVDELGKKVQDLKKMIEDSQRKRRGGQR